MNRRGKQTALDAPDRLLDANEVAAMLAVKPSTVYQWAYQRRIPRVKLFGSALRFRLSTIQKLMVDSESSPLRSLKD